MGNFEEILLRIKDITGKKKNKEIAILLKTTETTFGKWVSRGKIPYEQILNLCIENDYDIKYIFYGIRQNGIMNKNTIEQEQNYGNNIIGNNNRISPSSNNNKFMENLNKLPKKRQEYYYHTIKAETLNMED